MTTTGDQSPHDTTARLTLDAMISARRPVTLDIDITENGLSGRTRTFRPRTITESWSTDRGYRVMTRGPILTAAGRPHATHTATAAWDRPSLTPTPLRALLIGPQALREALRTHVHAATHHTVDPQ